MNTVVGDIEGNTDRMIEAIEQAQHNGADVIVFPELTTTGYPPEDLLLKPRFVQNNIEATNRVAEATGDIVSVFGFVDRDIDLYNAAAICHRGQIVGTYRKCLLPNYRVFDEMRYFAPGSAATAVYEIAGVKVGVSICADLWSPDGPILQQAAAGAELMLNLNSSPYYAGKVDDRERVLAVRASDASVPVVYVNQVGGQDELVFDGSSVVVDGNGETIARANQFIEELLFVDIEPQPAYRKRLLDPRGRAVGPFLPVVKLTSQSRASEPLGPAPIAPHLDPSAEIYSTLVLGTRDYVQKNGFTDVVVGLSGGIDSSLVAAIAVDALGPDRVHGVSMPSRYSSEGSQTDAQALADRLGIEMQTIAIETAHSAFEQMLKEPLGGDLKGLTDENLQSRLRAVTLMALSNEFGWLVLTTGNKSELAVGYSTLYGDSAGGFAVIKDVVKTNVYELCKWRNRQSPTPVIPESVLTKAPSAELRPDQKDQDSLPPYEVLDPILLAYVVDDMVRSEIEALGFDAADVARVVRLVDKAEYKRRQSPIGVRVTPKAFGRDRRVPITNGYPS